MVVPHLLLQKSHRTSKAKDHVAQLERRLKTWANGDLDELLHEGRTIQRQLSSGPNKSPSHDGKVAQRFSKLMTEGKVKAALRLITDQERGGLLPLDSVASSDGTTIKTVRDILSEKHPSSQPPFPSAICEPSESFHEPHSVHFDRIDGPLIRDTVLRMDGAAGPSGIDAAGWKRLCTSFRSHSSDLCDAIASLAKRICTAYLDPKGLEAFVACRLIALDKCPGVRPIGIGETLRRIIGKAISNTLKYDIQDAVGPLQLCAGFEGGCEAAVHAMQQLFSLPQFDAVIQVDACNAFNSLNRQTALRNILHLCPSLAKVLINTYRIDTNLYINGESILSQEGTTQGDPLAMAMYAISTTPLIHRLMTEDTKQAWFADDASAAGDLHALRRWWDHLIRIGPEYGYYPNATKTWLIVKEESYVQAQAVFRGSGVSITKEGKRHLGAAIGNDAFKEEYVREKVATWVEELERLTRIAESQPHAAYAAFTHGLASKWTFLARTVPDVSNLFQPLEDAIRQHFLPVLTGQSPFSDTIRDLMVLPTRLGGLGITNPVTQAAKQRDTSCKVTAPLVNLIVEQSKDLPMEALEEQTQAKYEARQAGRQAQASTADSLYTTLPNSLQKAVEISKESGASTWLTALPIEEHGFSLHKGAFRDALCLRYGWRPPLLPSYCVCDKTFSVEHALSCARGGFPTIRHNEIRNITAHLMSDVCHNVGIEPPLQ